MTTLIERVMTLVESYASAKAYEDSNGDYGPLCRSHGLRDEIRAEVERLKQVEVENKNLASLLSIARSERDTLRAELDKLKAQEKVPAPTEAPEQSDLDFVLVRRSVVKRTLTCLTTPENAGLRLVLRDLGAVVNAAPQAPAPERNFCERCGKRLVKGHIHTCTPPTGEAPECNNSLRMLGKPYPRTCRMCGITGPCKSPTVAQSGEQG